MNSALAVAARSTRNAVAHDVSLHINNACKEGELEAMVTVKDYLTVHLEGEVSNTITWTRSFQQRI